MKRLIKLNLNYQKSDDNQQIKRNREMGGVGYSFVPAIHIQHTLQCVFNLAHLLPKQASGIKA